MAKDYRPGDRWPVDQKGAESATLVMVCPCGGHTLETDRGSHCETCGRTFDDRGNRLIDEEDIDSDTGELIPMALSSEED